MADFLLNSGDIHLRSIFKAGLAAGYRITGTGNENLMNPTTRFTGKTAIVTGKIFGVGAGKSRMKNFLPQSSSDFIYAIIVEEFGLIGGIGLIILYLLLLFRIVVISYKATDVFGKLVVIGLGIPIIFQAFINMGVALQVLPVTGQTLPMISSGGTSAWMTCIAMGIILRVSAKKNLIEDQLDDEDINESNPISILSETL